VSDDPSLRYDLGRFIDSPRNCSRRAASAPAHAPRPRHLGPIKQLPARSATERAATIYAPEDALRLNALTRHLQGRLQPHLSRRCTHLRGHGGRHGAVRQIHDAIHRGTHRYVFRTDVKGYYDAIDPDILMDQLRPHVHERQGRALLYQYLHRCVHRDGVFRRIDFGIPTGCALSPLMAALYLTPLDRAMESLEPSGVFYVRYLDDLIILAPNRYKLRQAIRIVNQQLTALRLEQHPDKTFIGKLSRGFDALGSRFDAEIGVRGPSPVAVERFATRIVERYAHHEGGESLRHYVNRWLGSQIFGFSFEELDSPQTKHKQHRYDKQTTAPRSSPARCPEKNHTSSPPAGLS
jgi:RNA-directed DNA polymerase